MSVKKGCTQIRTLAAIKKSGSHSGDRHVHHFQVASLELERARRLRENEDALRRIQGNESRLVEIDALLQDHYRALGLTEEGDSSNGVHGTRDAEIARFQAASSRALEAPAAERLAGPTRRMVLYGR